MEVYRSLYKEIAGAGSVCCWVCCCWCCEFARACFCFCWCCVVARMCVCADCHSLLPLCLAVTSYMLFYYIGKVTSHNDVFCLYLLVVFPKVEADFYLGLSASISHCNCRHFVFLLLYCPTRRILICRASRCQTVQWRVFVGSVHFTQRNQASIAYQESFERSSLRMSAWYAVEVAVASADDFSG